MRAEVYELMKGVGNFSEQTFRTVFFVFCLRVAVCVSVWVASLGSWYKSFVVCAVEHNKSDNLIFMAVVFRRTSSNRLRLKVSLHLPHYDKEIIWIWNSITRRQANECEWITKSRKAWDMRPEKNWKCMLNYTFSTGSLLQGFWSMLVFLFYGN